MKIMPADATIDDVAPGTTIIQRTTVHGGGVAPTITQWTATDDEAREITHALVDRVFTDAAR